MNEQTMSEMSALYGPGEPATPCAPLPNHYVVLAIDMFEQDPEVIEWAARQRLAAEVCTQPGLWPGSVPSRSLVPIAAATACLLDPAQKAAYDAELAWQRRGGPAAAGPWLGAGHEDPHWACLPGVTDGHTEISESYLKRTRREDRFARMMLVCVTLALALGLALWVGGPLASSAVQWETAPPSADEPAQAAAETLPQDDLAEEPLPPPAIAEDVAEDQEP